MKISELLPGKTADVEGTIVDVDEVKTFVKFGRPLRLVTATLRDETGTIKLALWNQEIEKAKPGSIVKITNGYVKEFQGENQLTLGKLGKIEVIKEGTEPEQEKTPKSLNDFDSEKEESEQGSEPEQEPQQENQEDIETEEIKIEDN